MAMIFVLQAPRYDTSRLRCLCLNCQIARISMSRLPLAGNRNYRPFGEPQRSALIAFGEVGLTGDPCMHRRASQKNSKRTARLGSKSPSFLHRSEEAMGIDGDYGSANLRPCRRATLPYFLHYVRILEYT